METQRSDWEDWYHKVEECFNYKHVEKLSLIYIEAREGFSNCTESKINFAARINMNRERIKLIDKWNKHDMFPACDELENRENVMLCNKKQNKTETWMKKMETFVMTLQRKKRWRYIKQI